MHVPDPLIDRELVTRPGPGSLHEFVRLCFPVVETADFIDGWHIGVLCDYLERVSRCEILRLVINIPPGTGKSLIVGVFWPLWEWIHRPRTRWMFASYSPELSARDGKRVANVLQSPWFQKRFDTRLRAGAIATTRLYTARGGFRFATSVGGAGTGSHADIQVVDDPVKAQAVQWGGNAAKKAIANANFWWDGAMSTRRVDAATFRRVIIMQRLHADDLSGACLKKGYTHLCLPMEAEPDKICICGNADCTPEDPRITSGEILVPERFPPEVLDRDRTIGLGAIAYAAQNQQRPTTADGGIIKNSWFRYWSNGDGVEVPDTPGYPCRDTHCRKLPVNGQWIQSWDMSFKGSDGTDFVAGGVWFYDDPDIYLIDQVCARMSFVESCKALMSLSRRYPLAITKYVEEKANGNAIVNMLREGFPDPLNPGAMVKLGGLVLINPQGGKEARANACSGLFAAGNVFLPHDDLRTFLPEYREQLTSFPRSLNDDMVDQTTQAIMQLAPKRNYLVDAMQQVNNDL